jgi:serine/threonine protein kinase
MERITTLSEKKEFNIENILENPEALFSKDVTPQFEIDKARQLYEDLLLDFSRILGSGNNGIVFDSNDAEKNCIKCSWDGLTVAIKNKRFDLLPKKFQQLRKIEVYFAEISEKQRKLAGGNVGFAPPNMPLKEAGYQIAARKILEERGLNGMVPRINGVFGVELGDNGEEEGEIEGLPYSVVERATVVAMEKISGKSVQDLILDYPENFEQIKTLDVDEIGRKLTEAVKSFHEKNFSHQDLTLRNVMIDFKTGQPVIIDFGKSKYLTGEFSLEDELEHVRAVTLALKKFQSRPKENSDSLKQSFKKFNDKL